MPYAAGQFQAMTASSGCPVRWAYCTAQRRASADAGEPSTPTTIRPVASRASLLGVSLTGVPLRSAARDADLGGLRRGRRPAQRDADLEDPVLVRGLDVLLVGVLGERQGPREAAVAQLAPGVALVLLLLLDPPLRGDAEHAVLHGHVDVLLRVDVGKLSADDLVVALAELVHADDVLVRDAGEAGERPADRQRAEP